ncbi:MAG: hypothetical protein ACI9SE_001352 [Neolewinella sp.]|jgi:hypothetical protein
MDSCTGHNAAGNCIGCGQTTSASSRSASYPEIEPRSFWVELAIRNTSDVGHSSCGPDQPNPASRRPASRRTSALGIPTGLPTTSHTAPPPRPPRPSSPHPIKLQTTSARHQVAHAPAPTQAHQTAASSPAALANRIQILDRCQQPTNTPAARTRQNFHAERQPQQPSNDPMPQAGIWRQHTPRDTSPSVVGVEAPRPATAPSELPANRLPHPFSQSRGVSHFGIANFGRTNRSHASSENRWTKTPPGRHSSGRRNSRCRSAIEFPDNTNSMLTTWRGCGPSTRVVNRTGCCRWPSWPASVAPGARPC